MLKNKEKRQPIKVFLRVRPINEIERNKGSPVIVDCPNTKEVSVNERPGDKITKKFTFDKVFSPASNQVDLYKSVASPLMKEVLDGYNCTIFAYGQTGTGKTYTMEGVRGNPSLSWTVDPHSGIIPRALSHLFDELRLLEAEFSVKASYLELYNEELIDLLSPVDDNSKIRLFEDATKKGAVIVNGLEEVTVRNKDEVYSILEKGSKKRQTASTLMNAVSSRSHTVFSITVRIKESREEDGEEVLRTGKLNLVDLAGSENIGRSGAIDKRAREAGNINQSLLTLGRVITALVERTPHIPYRESKLTRLLQESLGGRTKTCIIATISPSYCNVEETLSTLDYAHRAKNIQNKPEINQKIGKTALIREYIEEIDRLKADLIATRERTGIFLAEDNYNTMMNQIQLQKREISELLLNTKTLTETSERKEELNLQLSESLHKFQEDLKQTRKLLKEVKLDREKHIFLLNHRMETEKELSQQAENLLSAADSATNDLSLLHNTLGRKRNLEETNLVTCGRFATACKEKLANMADLSANFKQARMQSSENLIEKLKSGYSSSKQSLAKNMNKLDHARETQISLINDICDFNKKLVNNTESHVAKIQESYSNSTNLDVNALTKFFDEILGKLQQVNVECAQYQRNQHNLIEEITSKVEKEAEDIQRFIISSNKTLRELHEGMEIQETVLARVNSMAENMTMWKANMEKKTREAMEAMLREYDYIEKEKDSLQNSLSNVNLVKLNSHIESLSTGVKKSQKNLNKLTSEVSSFASVSDQKGSDCINSINKSFSQIGETITEQQILQPERHRMRLMNVCDSLSTLSLDTNGCSTEIESTAEELLRGVEPLSQENENWVKDHLEKGLQLVETCEKDIREESDSVNVYCSDFSDTICGCKNVLEKFVEEEFEKDTPSGCTPQRRDFSYPRSLVFTSPHERILSRFRCVEEDEEESVFENPNGTSNSSEKECSSSSSIWTVQLGKFKSKSVSNISSENMPCNFPCTSEPNIPCAMLGKENTSPSKNIPAGKHLVLRRQVLGEHN